MSRWLQLSRCLNFSLKQKVALVSLCKRLSKLSFLDVGLQSDSLILWLRPLIASFFRPPHVYAMLLQREREHCRHLAPQ